MAENTSPAMCSEDEFRMAQEAGLLIVTTGEESAVHKFAEAIRAQAMAACQTVLDMKEEARALEASHQAKGTEDELDRLHHWLTVSTFNAGVRRCIAAIQAD